LYTLGLFIPQIGKLIVKTIPLFTYYFDLLCFKNGEIKMLSSMPDIPVYNEAGIVQWFLVEGF
jgi:hypothetical protein